MRLWSPRQPLTKVGGRTQRGVGLPRPTSYAEATVLAATHIWRDT